MSILFDDSPVMLFASVACLIMCFELVVAIPVAWTMQPEEGKVQLDTDVSFPRRDEKLFVLSQC